MPSGSFPSAFSTLTPAQAYQSQTRNAAAASSTSLNASASASASGSSSVYGGIAGQGSNSALPSPASNVFPHRSVSSSAGHVHGMPRIHTGDAEIGTAISPDYAATPMPQPSGSAYRQAPGRPTIEVGYGPLGPTGAGGSGARYNGGDRSRDYLPSMDSLSIGGGTDDGPGMLGDIPGIPKRGDESPTVKEFSSLAARFSGEYGRDTGAYLFQVIWAGLTVSLSAAL